MLSPPHKNSVFDVPKEYHGSFTDSETRAVPAYAYQSQPKACSTVQHDTLHPRIYEISRTTALALLNHSLSRPPSPRHRRIAELRSAEIRDDSLGILLLLPLQVTHIHFCITVSQYFIDCYITICTPGVSLYSCARSFLA
jgi:hypothetical protein